MRCVSNCYTPFSFTFTPQKTPSQTSSPVSNPNRNKYVTSLVNSTVNKALPAFAAERRDAAPGCGAVAAGRTPLSIDISCPHGAQQQTHRRDGQTDGHLTVT